VSGFSVKVDVAEVDSLGGRLGKLDTARLARAATRAVQSVATTVFDESKKRINRTLNLSDAYVAERMRLRPVAETSGGRTVSATISALRGAGAPSKGETSLRNYEPVQMTRPVKWTNSMIADKIGRLGPHPTKLGSLLPWTERTGDKLRAIPADQEADGIAVHVTRGSPKRIASAFLLPLRSGKAGGANGIGIVRRDASGRIAALYGPAVYQVFRNLLPEIEESTVPKLRTAVLHELDVELRGVLT
jgi:hypothetical protein